MKRRRYLRQGCADYLENERSSCNGELEAQGMSHKPEQNPRKGWKRGRVRKSEKSENQRREIHVYNPGPTRMGRRWEERDISEVLPQSSPNWSSESRLKNRECSQSSVHLHELHDVRMRRWLCECRVLHTPQDLNGSGLLSSNTAHRQAGPMKF